MDMDMVKEMEEYGIEFGGHTKTHPKLANLLIEEAKKRF